ncbi:capsid protein [Clostridium perfringens]|uniref:capsid protein n=2 Tax=Clostridium perfringens TaxID=1502 RepID=UPI0018E40517|nr:capsid protein [Clostridium perfringens]MBI6017011.1 capsid protein [Clostridium perfringens]MDK0588567.1 capsid protein [Clostridium perfringens]MDM0527336.1 capsid protein [Clostridium perfringens]MDM0529211.1 capsid protein [Clostridium perfringens]MDM0539322.1 capsid protein [Clostridium perfringens]
MGWFKSMLTKAAIKYLNVQPALTNPITIQEAYTFETNVIRNKLWYRGEPYELDQFFKNISSDPVNKARFWSAVPSEDLSIRKIHSGLPAMIADKLSDIVVADLDSIEVTGEADNTLWEEIRKDNKFDDMLGDIIATTLVSGDGAFKLSIDTEISKYPIIEFFDGDKVEYITQRGRLKEVKFYTFYTKNNRQYKLSETYGKGYINYNLYDSNGNEVSLNTLDETKELVDVTYKDDFIMAVPLMFFKSPKFEGKGKSIFDNKSDAFDALDEVISQWIDAIRDGRVQKYIPEDLVPKDINGNLMKPNPFDNRFLKVGSSLAEDAKNEIDMKQANINYEAYVESYSNAIDMCLQGIISPSTLGIDLKKTDNAEAQREKEKTTLYTRGKLVDILTEVIPELVNIILKTNDVLNKKNTGEYEVSIVFGEYASPSFDSVVETVGKAKTYGVMSIEQCIEEMYGDTWTDEEKEEEIQRIKEQNGYLVAEEPKTVDDSDMSYTDDNEVETDGQEG